MRVHEGGMGEAGHASIEASESPLDFSTYIGGSGWDEGMAIASDEMGYIYVTGRTTSEDFPVTKEGVSYNGGLDDVFVTKWGPTGNLVYSTLLGGSGYELGMSITADGNGSALITGYTSSDDFPLKQAIDSVLGGELDAFITRLNADGDVEYSTYFGGSDNDRADCIALDQEGNVVITGYTDSADFPTENAFDDSLNGGADCFVTKLDIRTNTILYSTFVGGSDQDYGKSIVLSPSGHVYIAGSTWSSDFPTIDAIDTTLGGDSDAFLFELDSSGSSLEFSTYLGGDSDDRAMSICLNSVDNIYIVGRTRSDNFPTVPVQTKETITSDGFVVRVNTTSKEIIRSRFLGGMSWDQTFDVAVNEKELFVCGSTESSDFPQAYNPYPTTISRTAAYILQLDAEDLSVDFSVVLDGNMTNVANSISCDTSGRFYVTGSTNSPTFLVANAEFPEFSGQYDAFVLGMLDPGDSDEDGLLDYHEMAIGTDRLDNDTDGDGMPDGWEYFNGLDPLVDDSMEDPDSDYLSNLDEYRAGTDPLNSDSDGDGMPDGWEYFNGLDPLVDDSMEDPDSDYLSNLDEYRAGTDPLNSDSDGDGMPDGWEVRYGFDPTDSSIPLTEILLYNVPILLVAINGLIVSGILYIFKGWKEQQDRKLAEQKRKEELERAIDDLVNEDSH